MTRLRAVFLSCLAVLVGTASVGAKRARSDRAIDIEVGGFGMGFTRFALLDAPVGKTKRPPGDERPAHLAGSSIATLDDGALVIDPDSGALIRTGKWGKREASLEIGADAALLVVDRAAKLAYVTNRKNDRVEVVSVANKLTKKRAIATRTEPFGIALSPDKKTLLVTTVADQQLTAYDAASGKESWSIELGPEPRGVAIAPDGKSAMVGMLTTGSVARVDLSSREVEHIPLHRGTGENRNAFGFQQAGVPDAVTDSLGKPAAGRGFARNAFAAAFIGHDLAIVPHQLSIPHQDEGSENVGSYGGGFSPPIAHRVAVVGPKGAAELSTVQIGVHQPRAVAYDPGTDRLYVAGFGSDDLAVIGDVSQASIHLSYETTLQKSGQACGPTGIALDDGGRTLVFCSLSRTLAIVVESEAGGIKLTAGAELAKSRLSKDVLAGRALFRQGANSMLSANGAMACESCHPEGRTDGLSWRIEGKVLQTPVLAGRVLGTHPFKWDGGDKSLPESLTNTVRRLGGGQLPAEQVGQLQAFLESLDKPRTPAVRSKKAVARGKKLFRSRQLGCARCHSGKLLTDGNQYDLSTDLKDSDTPSLIGVALSAPYYHDGSAANLEALLRESGTVHGMGNLDDLSDRDMSDLIAYLETL